MSCVMWFFFFNDTATTEIYTLSLPDALPILRVLSEPEDELVRGDPLHAGTGADARRYDPSLVERRAALPLHGQDRKSTRLNSSHANISYAVFCLKKKKTNDRL